MAGSGSRNDPFTSFNFIVDIQGMKAGFSEVGGLTSETDVAEYREGNEETTVRKIPTKTKFSNLTLKRGMTDNHDLYKWRRLVEQGKTQRLPGTITLLDEARKPALVWKFYEAWPVKWAGPAFNAKNNEIAIEELNLAIEGLELE
jgi:phage tail-like protein